MERQNTYLLGLGVLLFITVIFLAFTGENRVEVYLTSFTVVYIAYDLIMRPLRRARWDWVGAGLFSMWVLSLILIFI